MPRANSERLHVGLIMDGNGRWAERRGLPRVAGHRAGVAALRRTVEAAPDFGVGCLTVYAFSSDNWRRPPAEVEGIFWLLRAFLRLETQRMQKQGVRLEVIGRRDRLSARVLHEIAKAEEATAPGSRLHLRVAIDYSSRDSIARAAADAMVSLLNKALPCPGTLAPMLERCLKEECCDVDLLIRTGGEKRLSDFLLWESAYAELFFTDRMWPDFDQSDLEAALCDFRHRERRFGGLPSTIMNQSIQAAISTS